MKWFRSLLCITITITMCILGYSAVSRADVIERNGDYRLVAADSEGMPLFEASIVRYYHSGWQESGLFGNGWMTDLDFKVVRGEDNRLSVLDLCSGDQLAYQVSGKKTANGSDEGAPGSSYTNTRCGCTDITILPDGYKRVIGDRIEYFGSNGMIKSISAGSSRRLDIKRDDRGKVLELRAESGQILTFTYDKMTGNIASIGNGGKNILTYSYDQNGRLSSVVKNGGELHTYTYLDGLLSHYSSPGNDEWVTYSDDDSHKVKSVRTADGDVVTYAYHSDTPDRLKHTTVATRTASGEIVDTREYRFTELRDEDGKQWVQHLVEYIDGDMARDTTYAPNYLPLQVNTPYSSVQYVYDERGRVISSISADKSVEFGYDRNSGKVASVKTIEHPEETVTTTRYTYDNKGNLVKAEDSNGRSMNLTYNSLYQIEKIEEGGQALAFTYGPLGKPERIELLGIGAIDVTYDPQGEIDSVHSDKGSDISLKITSIFGTLLEMLRQAKVNF